MSYQVDMVRSALRDLSRHKLRTLLTLLGVLIGVAAVITMLGIGEGAQQNVMRDIAGLGLRNIIIESVQPSVQERPQQSAQRGPRIQRYGLNDKDAQQLKALHPGIELLQVHLVKEKVFERGRRLDAQVLGVPPEYDQAFTLDLVQGRRLSALDDRDLRRVVVVSEPLAAALFGQVGKPLSTLQIGDRFFDVVGVARVGARTAAPLIFMPYRTAMANYGTMILKREAGSAEFSEVEIGQIVVRSPEEDLVPGLAAAVKRTLELSHPAIDYRVTVPLEILQTKQRTQRILNLVLIAIAAISLLVGGIGIMNIMLAVVTERIPEIGLRRAVGASQRDILRQFLTETVTLSTVGGLLGCLVGFVTVPLASHWTGWPGVITPWAVVISLAVSWCVGLVFGLAPAARAARMDPVDALRHQ
mgnify:FL=1